MCQLHSHFWGLRHKPLQKIGDLEGKPFLQILLGHSQGPSRVAVCDLSYLIHFSRPRDVVVAPQKRSQDQPADLDTLLYDMNAFAEANVRRQLDVELEVGEGAGI